MNYTKKYKLIKLQNIKKKYKYIYIFRYTDLTVKENILLKKNIKQSYKSFIIKKNLDKNEFANLTGSILLICTNLEFDKINHELFKLLKLELIKVINNKNEYSKLKLKKLLIQANNPLNLTIIKPLFIFLFFLKKISLK